MTPDNAGPISRPFPLHRVTPEGVDAEVVATANERATLAADLGLPAIHELAGRFRVSGTPRRLSVTGRVRAEIEQTCVVSLDPFRSTLDEEVEVEFQTPPTARAAASRAPEAEAEADLDGPEELVGDRIDLGAITAEFLTLGLDPHPRKPGIVFEAPAAAERALPFANLAALRSKGPGET